jgi:hypothetical protein
MKTGTGSQLTARNRGTGRRMKGLSVALALIGGAWMRLWMLRALPQISPDTLLYGGMAKNMLLHGQFAITDGSGVVHETLIRLPGYPLFLALCFRLFGVDNYTAVSYIQIGLELAGCLLLADFVRRIAPNGINEGAAQGTLWLAALCPFTAAYAVAPLTETPTLFAIALAMWALARFVARPGWWYALAFTFAIVFAAHAAAGWSAGGRGAVPALVWGLWRPDAKQTSGAEAPADSEDLVVEVKIPTNQFATSACCCAWPRFASAGAASICHLDGQKLARLSRLRAAGAALRHRSGRVYQSRLAAVDEDLVPGFCVHLRGLLERAGQHARSEQAAEPGLRLAGPVCGDGGAGCRLQQTTGRICRPNSMRGLRSWPKSASRRIRCAITSGCRWAAWPTCGLRPRVENLNIDLDWWVYSHHYAETRFSWAYAGLNAAYLLMALAGLCFRPRYWPWMLLYFVMRSAMLSTIEAPEARYTLECFPMVFALGGVGIYGAYKGIATALRSRANSTFL